MSPRIAFRVDADETIGLGHLARATTLAEAFARRGASCVFLTTTPDAVRAERREVVAIAAQRGSREDALATATLAASATRLVLDGYAFGATYARELGLANALWIDDGGFADDRAGLVLNHNLYATPALYPGKATSDLLLGAEFALLRGEIVRARDLPPEPHPERRVLVTMGGSDPPNVTARVLEALDGTDLAVRVLVGRLNPHREALGLRARGAQVIVGASNVGEHLRWADVVVSAAGGTAMEVACVGVPAVVTAIADNQRPVADALARLGLARSLGWHEDWSPEALRAAIDAALAAPAAMREAQRAMIDGNGKDRVAARALEVP